jgi:uncharacterized SAM-binding protein YcdF (DUF218 family)
VSRAHEAESRVIVVLGYSDRERDRLHPVCAERLAAAAEVATAHDVVVLSGWARAPGSIPEAELMRRAWRGTAAQLVVDPDARTTAENAWNALDDVVRTRAREVVVVTSRWHAARARAAFRAVLRGRGVRVTVVSPPGTRAGARLRELPLWPLLPLQLAVARRRRRTTR